MKDAEWGRHNLVIRKGADGAMVVEKRPIPGMPRELSSIIQEMG
jgi:hypothetical protein